MTSLAATLRALARLPREDLDFDVFRLARLSRPLLQAPLADVSAADPEDVLARFFQRFLPPHPLAAPTWHAPARAADEEATLVWADRGRDQLGLLDHRQSYAFLLPDGRRVRLRLAGRGGTLALEALHEAEGELHLRFGSRRGRRTQPQALAASVGPDLHPSWAEALLQPDPLGAPTLLGAHLALLVLPPAERLVHRELRPLLRQSLRTFLAEEALQSPDRLPTLLALAEHAEPLLAALARFEELQRTLWMQVPAVRATSWCLDRDPLPDLPPREGPLDTASLDTELQDRVHAALAADEEDASLLVQADNLQALTLLGPRYAGEVACAYLDPPFNTEDGDFAYRDRFAPSAWLSFLDGRLRATLPLLRPDGSLYLHLDHHAAHLGRLLLDEALGRACFQNEVIWRIGWVSGFKTAAPRFVRNHDVLLVYGRTPRPWFDKEAARIPFRAHPRRSITAPLREIRRAWQVPSDPAIRVKLSFKAPDGRVWKLGLKDNEGRYPLEDTWNCHEYEDLHSNKIKRSAAEYTPNGSRLTQKPEQLLRRILEVTTRPGDRVLEAFAGTGTGSAVAAKLGRRFLAVEVGAHFDTDLLHRMKQVLAGHRVGISHQVPHRPGGAFRVLRLAPGEDLVQGVTTDPQEPALLLLERGGLRLHPSVLADPLRASLAGEPLDLLQTLVLALGLRVARRASAEGVRAVLGADGSGASVLLVLRAPTVDDEALMGLLDGEVLAPADSFDILCTHRAGEVRGPWQLQHLEARVWGGRAWVDRGTEARAPIG